MLHAAGTQSCSVQTLCGIGSILLQVWASAGLLDFGVQDSNHVISLHVIAVLAPITLPAVKYS